MSTNKQKKQKTGSGTPGPLSEQNRGMIQVGPSQYIPLVDIDSAQYVHCASDIYNRTSPQRAVALAVLETLPKGGHFPP